LLCAFSATAVTVYGYGNFLHQAKNTQNLIKERLMLALQALNFGFGYCRFQTKPLHLAVIKNFFSK